jgi:uncharacterized membrane protein YccC
VDLSFADFSVGSIVGSIIGSIIGSMVGSIVGSAISALGCELFLFLLFSVVNVRSAVAWTMIYMPFINFLARVQEDGEVMQHFPFQNIVLCPPKSNF